MAWTNKKGFNFRQTLGFVTDGANEKFINAAFGAYPQSITIDGDTFNVGWETAPVAGQDRDRSVSPDPRLAGIVYVASGDADVVFRVDLPSAGDYEIEIAGGDAGNSGVEKFELRDTTTALITRSEVSRNLDEYTDASLTVRTPASTWVSSNTAVTKTFSTTILRFVLQAPSTSVSVLAHFSIKQISAGGAPVLMGQCCT